MPFLGCELHCLALLCFAVVCHAFLCRAAPRRAAPRCAVPLPHSGAGNELHHITSQYHSAGSELQDTCLHVCAHTTYVHPYCCRRELGRTFLDGWKPMDGKMYRQRMSSQRKENAAPVMRFPVRAT